MNNKFTIGKKPFDTGPKAYMWSAYDDDVFLWNDLPDRSPSHVGFMNIETLVHWELGDAADARLHRSE